MADRDLPGLLEAGHRAGQARTVLQDAIAQLHPPKAGEDFEAIAKRLRGAAVLATTAGLELAVVSGWNEAAAIATTGVER